MPQSPARNPAARCWSLAAMLLLATTAAAQQTHTLHAGGVDLVLSLDDDLRADARGEPWRQWIVTGLEAARTVTGAFPRPRVRIDLRSTRSSDAVAYGQVRRARTPRIRFWVSRDAELDELNADWRGFHEFAHLLIPFPGNRDIWFTEGLASYYQYLLQSRAGLVPPRDAWANLLAGLERGRSDRAGRGRTLRSLSPDMWRERAFKRVYWTGAAFFLRVDTRLRTETRGRHSLDSALAAFHRCCLDDDRDWTARQLVETLGRLSVPEIWRQEYFRTIDREATPDTGRALDRLGLAGDSTGIVFGNAAEAVALRRAIAAPRPAGHASESDAP